MYSEIQIVCFRVFFISVTLKKKIVPVIYNWTKKIVPVIYNWTKKIVPVIYNWTGM